MRRRLRGCLAENGEGIVTLGRLLIAILLGGLALAGGALIAHTTVIPWLIHRQGAVLVPEMVGMTLEEAEAAARHVGLSVAVGDEIHQDGAPPGTVLEHVPRAMRSVRQGRTIRLITSKGEAFARVPDLLGMSLRQCEISLMREGLELGRVARSYDPLGRPGVAAQRPHPGSSVQRDTAVDLVLRQERERQHYRVPSLVGRSLVKVREELTSAGFELRRITYAANADAFPGTVLEQWPRAGSRIVEGGGIELVASTRN